MKRNHDERRRKAGRVREPVQVYLEAPDRERLERLADRLDTTKSDVLRQGLEALELQLTDPTSNPVLNIIGIADREIGPLLDYNPAVEFGRFLEETEPGIAPAPPPATPPPGRSDRAP